MIGLIRLQIFVCNSRLLLISIGLRKNLDDLAGTHHHTPKYTLPHTHAHIRTMHVAVTQYGLVLRSSSAPKVQTQQMTELTTSQHITTPDGLGLGIDEADRFQDDIVPDGDGLEVLELDHPDGRNMSSQS